MTAESLAQCVQHYLAELQHGDSDNAFHCLTEADPAIVPLLVGEFTRATDATLRRELLDVTSVHCAVAPQPSVEPAGAGGHRTLLRFRRWTCGVER